MKDDSTPFIDLLFNLLLGYAFLFLVSFLLIQPIVKKAEVSTQAEFIVTVTWPVENTDDVDTWLADPLGNVIWFGSKENGLMHLDRDDLGSSNDTIYLADGSKIEYPYNQELATIRGFIAGEWVLNLHMYKKREDEVTPVKVTVDKLNPRFETILAKEIPMSTRGDEITVARITMGQSGQVFEINDMPKNLVQLASSTSSVAGGG